MLGKSTNIINVYISMSSLRSLNIFAVVSWDISWAYFKPKHGKEGVCPFAHSLQAQKHYFLLNIGVPFYIFPNIFRELNKASDVTSCISMMRHEGRSRPSLPNEFIFIAGDPAHQITSGSRQRRALVTPSLKIPIPALTWSPELRF